MIVYMIRHGETTSDVEDRYGGDYDDHLTEKGRREVEELTSKLKNEGIQIIFSSPLIRTQETSRILANAFKVNIRTINVLKERNLYSVLTGMKKSEAKEKYPEFVERIGNYKDAIDGAEKYEDFVERVKKALNEVYSSDYEKVAAVTHGGPIRVVFRELLGLGGTEIHDCAYAILEYKEGVLSLKEKVGIEILTE